MMNLKSVSPGLVVIAAALLFFSISQAVGPPGDPQCNVKFQSVLHQQQTGVSQGRDFVIETEEEWCEFWDEIYSFLFPPPKCDTDLIDFETEVAIVSALGERPNSCYSNAITCIEGRSLSIGSGSSEGAYRSLTVYVEEVVPGPGCNCFMSIVKPVHVVKVRKPVGDVRFVHYKTELECD